ncbi:MAG: DUF2141 domain-containing protein [Parvularculaceae bacterium]|nr:DUF2141 domain-containing protein [Parvularculaceae bacterium]
MLTTLLLMSSLTVIVEDVRSDAGQIYVSIQAESEYMQQTGTAGSIEDPEKGTMEFEYDVAPGTYAVSIWHDENGNGVFDREESGMPLDGWALSSKSGGWQFDDVSFELKKRDKTVRVEMTYPK